jgi:hypothetical protein
LSSNCCCCRLDSPEPTRIDPALHASPFPSPVPVPRVRWESVWRCFRGNVDLKLCGLCRSSCSAVVVRSSGLVEPLRWRAAAPDCVHRELLRCCTLHVSSLTAHDQVGVCLHLVALATSDALNSMVNALLRNVGFSWQLQAPTRKDPAVAAGSALSTPRVDRA